MKKILLILLLVICLPLIASADGKFYARERVPPDLPYQRAIISYQDGEELLILQSKFEGEADDFGWVIPMPVPPKLGSIKREISEDFFWHLGQSTLPKVIRVRETLFITVFLILLGLVVLLIVERISCAVRRKPLPKFFQGSLNHPLLIIPILFVVAAISIPNLLSSRLAGVEILSKKQVGVYDVKVIKASNALELINWLNEHKYQFTKQDEAAFNSYIQRGWCFVTARINTAELKKNEFRSNEGVVNPLVMVFPSTGIVYPLKLTATVGSKTEILLYVFAQNKVQTDNRFEMEWAGESDSSVAKLPVESPDNLDVNRFRGMYLTKFRGKLLPEQMDNDLILIPAIDNKPYRKTIWK
jgi:hypothetical protein